MPKEKLTDRKIAVLARQYSVLGGELAKVGQKRKDLAARIIDELHRRGTKALEHEGMRVTVVDPVEIAYDEELLEKAARKGKIPEKLYKKMFKKVLDKGAIESMVMAGQVDGDVIAECSVEVPKASSIRVSSLDKE